MFDEDEIGNMDSALQDGIENQLKLIEAALDKAEKDRESLPELIMIASRWESICEILGGKEPSDFMLSFPEVMQIRELIDKAKG